MFFIGLGFVSAQGYEEYGFPQDSTSSANAEWSDDWLVGGGIGLSTLLYHGNTPRLSEALEINVTKLVTPAIAFRFGAQGFRGHETFTPYFYQHSPLPYDPSTNEVSWDYFYLHFDLMWNLTNAIRGYDPDRHLDVLPYLHGGYQRMFDPKAFSTNYDREVVCGAGVLATYRVGDNLHITADLRDGNFSSRFHDYREGGRANLLTATFGILYSIPCRAE